MKKVKKQIKQSPKPQPITYKFTPEQMIFSVKGQELFLNRSQASFLFGQKAEIEFEKANDQDDDFSKFETVENLALFKFHSGRNMPVKKIAEEMNFPVKKYIRWVNTQSGWFNMLMSTHQIDIDRKIKELEEKNPLPEPKKEEEFWPETLGKTSRAVAFMLLDGLGPRQIAIRLKIPYDKFLRWYSDKNVIRNLMRIRNEEATRRGENHGK